MKRPLAHQLYVYGCVGSRPAVDTELATLLTRLIYRSGLFPYLPYAVPPPLFPE